jgi:diketogulonate reductase-like aldo/keto reductase
MTIPTKKLHDGFEMPVMGLGTWRMGGDFSHNPENDDQADITAIQNAIEAGITHIDTAEKYAGGYTETLLGKAIKGYDRKKLFLVTKIREEHLAYKDVLPALIASLEHLGTSYLDMYMIHGPNLNVPIEETMKALDEVVDQRLVRYLVFRNLSLERLKKAQAVCHHKIQAVQYHYNLRFREAEKKGIIQYCQDRDIMCIAWRPVQKGMLSTDPPQVVADLCKKYGKTPSQIAINWLISQKDVVTLSKMGHKEHLMENLGALGGEMEAEDIEKLRTEFPDQQNISDSVPLKE